MKRNLDPLFLPHSPLVFTLGIVQFDPVLAIEKYIPEIQEALRKNGFPKLRERRIQRQLLKVGSDESQRIEIKAVKQWEFHDIENQTSILVDQETLGVQTTHYSTYEEFKKLLELGLKTVGELMSVSGILRCGLRYIDAIDQPEQGGMSAWVKDELLGLKKLDGFERLNNHSSTQLESTDGSKLVVKATFARQGIVLPPDLLPCDLSFKHKPFREKPFLLLDLDHYSEKEFAYKLEAALKELENLHGGLDEAFRSSVTPNALEQWKKA